jgi:AcrR family transcriptional regulator
MRKNRKEDVLRAAVDLFASKGFKGSTTRELAARAKVNEAIIFRYFKTKRDLYRAILDFKASGEDREARRAEMKKLAASKDDKSFFEAIARIFLEKHKKDTTFLRLLLFSALEKHEFVEMFLMSLSDQNPLARHIQSRINEGAFRNVNPDLAAHAFLGMLVSFVLFQEIIAPKNSKKYKTDKVVATYVSIFLEGIKPCPPCDEPAT